MRLAVVSDIHGNLPALEAVVADLRRRGVDAVVNLGDSLSGPLLPRETARFLMAQDWFHLAGNHERQILDTATPRGPSDAYAYDQLTAAELDWIAAQRPCARYGPAPDVLLCHATPERDDVDLLETVEPGGVRAATPAQIEERLGGGAAARDAALILCGHTHVPRSVRSARGQLIVNPGSVGLPGYLGSRPFPYAVQTGSPDARYAIVERTRDGWCSALVAVPYDARPMAELARRHGREEWARALLTGYVAR